MMGNMIARIYKMLLSTIKYYAHLETAEDLSCPHKVPTVESGFSEPQIETKIASKKKIRWRNGEPFSH